MICIRCNKQFSTDQAERNAEVFGGNVLACPHCGQAYSVRKVVEIRIKPITHTSLESDDWGVKITQQSKA